VTDTLADFTDPARALPAAVARIRHALALDVHPRSPAADRLEALHQLEKAHYRIERAQRALAADLLAQQIPLVEIADATQTTVRTARRRFARP
jgi:transcriptional regulator GlxA family with amidase domain